MSPVARELEDRVAGVREHLVRRTGLGAALWAATALVALWVIAWALAGPTGWRQGSDVPVLLDLIGLVVLAAGAFMLRRAALRWYGEAPLAAAIERSVGLPSGSVRGSLELARGVPSGVSVTLAERAARGAMADLGGRSPDALSDSLGRRADQWIGRGRLALGFSIALLLIVTLISPSRTGRALSGLTSPIGTMLDPVLPPIVVTPGSVEVMRGSDVQIEVRAAGRSTLGLSWQAEGEVARSEDLTILEGRGAHVFASVTAPVEYRFVDEDGSTTEVFNIQPIDPLFIGDLVIEVTYPEHTGLPPEEHRGETPPLRLPVGTRLTVEGRASRELSGAGLTPASNDTVIADPVVSLDTDGFRFAGSWIPSSSGVLQWLFLDMSGDAAEIQPEPMEIELVPDSVPFIAIPVPGVDTILPTDLRQPLVLDARDDYGLRSLELVAYRVTAFGDRRPPVAQTLDLGGTRAALARPLLDLSSWGLLPGDTIRYFARATDNSPARQTSVSREFVLRMPDAAELRREAERTLESMAQELSELASRAAAESEANRNQAMEGAANREERQASAGPSETSSDFDQREGLEQALENQAEMAARIDSMQAELRALEETMENAGQADPELRRELQELQELLEELVGEDLQERMERLADALQQENSREANRSLEQLAQEQEAMRQRLEESLERFRRAAVEQDFRATTQEAEDLARQERTLADAMREGDQPEARAEQQAALEQRAGDLESQMERLGERLEELGEREAGESVQRATQSARDAQRQMQRARQQTNRGENQSAGEEADVAADEMDEAARALQEAQAEMAQQQMEAAQRAMRQAADDALTLARRQSELRQRMRGASGEQLSRMRGDEASLLRGVENMAENLQVGTEGAAGSNREVLGQLGQALLAIEETIAALGNRMGTQGSPYSRAEEAVGALNELALQAFASAQQMGDNPQGQTGDQVSDQLEELAQQQGEVMNQSGQIMPMQLGQQAMAQQMEGLSQDQQSVSQELGELANQPGSEEALGDLEQMAAEAEALAQALAEGRLTPEVLERQERLFHRLLDAGRSLEREETSEERESEEPEDFQRGDVLPLTDRQLGVMPYEIPDGQELRELSPAVRQLVLDYFERLNRAPGDGGTGGGGS